MTTPPPPNYAPTVGRSTTWWGGAAQAVKSETDKLDLQAFADRLGQIVTETPEDRAARQHAEREAAYKAAGETADERKARHRAEKQASKRAAARARRRAKEGDSGRAKRFRRWCILTALSASIGYELGLVQALAAAGTGVSVLAAAAGWALDLRIRSWGDVAVSEVRRPIAIAVLVVCRVPLASALTAALHILST